MAFNKLRFARLAAPELSANFLAPLMFTYNAEEDTIEDCLALGYFGFGPSNPQYDPKQSQAGRVNLGTLILAVSNNVSGIAVQYNGILTCVPLPDGTIWARPWVPFSI